MIPYHKVLSKEVRKIPKGVTTIYEIESNYFGSQSNFLYSRNVLNNGKTSVYVTDAYRWEKRKYKYYIDINSLSSSSSLLSIRCYKMEEAVKEYENQLT